MENTGFKTLSLPKVTCITWIRQLTSLYGSDSCKVTIIIITTITSGTVKIQHAKNRGIFVLKRKYPNDGLISRLLLMSVHVAWKQTPSSGHASKYVSISVRSL